MEKPAVTVLYVVDALGLGGKTKSLVDLATHLDPNRYRAAVCSFVGGEGILEDNLSANGIRLYTVPCKDGLDFGTVARLMPILRQVGPDIVHCYNPRPIIYGGLAARVARMRGIVGSLSAFACQVPDRDYAFLPQRLSTVTRRNVYRNRVASRLMHRIVTVSRALGERFFRYNDLPQGKLRVVPYGVDVDKALQYSVEDVTRLRGDIGIAPGQIVIGSVGRLVEQKDYPTQLRAFAIAAKQVPELRMVLAGGGPLGESMKRLAEELGIADRLRFLGMWERVPLLMRSLDIFVLASKFEPYGVVLLEAKAAGLPIAATRVNEVPEIVTDGHSGVLAEAEDPDSLARVFVELACNPGLRRQLGANALEEARRQHSLQAMVEGYQGIYDELRAR